MAKVTRRPLRSSAAPPRVRTVSGSAIRARTGQISALRRPISRRRAERGQGAVEDEAAEQRGEQQQGEGVQQQDQQAAPDDPDVHRRPPGGTTLRGFLEGMAGSI